MIRISLCCVMLLLLVGCLLGCGAPMYPERSFRVNPRTGDVWFSSTQEEDIVVGQFTARDADRCVTLGTTTQPAVVYGAKSVGAMAQYAVQQAEYTKMLDVVGKNTTEQIRALGEAIPNLAGLLTGLGASQSQISSATAPLELLLERLRGQQAAVQTCTGSTCE